MKTKLTELSKISQIIGARPEYVQGGGGNISIKIDDTIMAIKASGYELKNVTADNGFALVNYKNIIDFINRKNFDDNSFTKFVINQTLSLNSYPLLRPSIETGFHSLLETFVIHTHSIYSNILCCAVEGEELAKKIFKNIVWINYFNPGKDLTIGIKTAIENKKTNLLFCQNHGIIISENSADKALNIHQEINEKIKQYFKITKPFDTNNKDIDLEFMQKNILFPDQVVYTQDEKLKISKAGTQTLAAYWFILNHIQKNKLTPSFISQINTNKINNMESEKYRKEIALK